MARPGPEVDCRLEVISDLAKLRNTSRRDIVAAIADLIPSLTAFAAELTDNDDGTGEIPGHLAFEVKTLAS